MPGLHDAIAKTTAILALLNQASLNQGVQRLNNQMGIQQASLGVCSVRYARLCLVHFLIFPSAAVVDSIWEHLLLIASDWLRLDFAHKRGVHYVIEQPRTSVMFRYRPLKKLLAKHNAKHVAAFSISKQCGYLVMLVCIGFRVVVCSCSFDV